MTYTRIIGTGRYLPEKVLSNHDLEKMVDTTDEWITERTGIKRRHILAEDETTSTMAHMAAKEALAAAQVKAQDLDMIIVGTSSGDRIFPSAAVLLQNHLSVGGCPAFDVAAACSGFLYALSIADKFIKAGAFKHILVVGAEALSRFVDWSDRNTCVLFGDGAGAVVLRADQKPGIISTHIHADGKYQDLLYAPNHLDRMGEPPYLKMNGREVFKVAVKTLDGIVDETLKYNNIDKSEINWLIPHQANYRIIKATAKRLEMPMERVILTVQDHANTSAASIPLALDTGVRDGRIKPDDLLLMEAFGGGFTWGSALLRF